MTARRKLRLAFLTILAVLPTHCCVVEPLILPLFNPLRQSPERIAARLHEQTPLGTSKADVLDYIEARGWRTRVSNFGEPPNTVGAEIGRHSAMLVFTASVDAFWTFDDHDRLIGIHVEGFIGDMP